MKSRSTLRFEIGVLIYLLLGNNVVIDDLVRIETHIARVLTQKAPGKNRRRKDRKTTVLESFEVANRDLGDVGYLAERNTSDLSLMFQPTTETDPATIGGLVPWMGSEIFSGSITHL